MNKKIGGLVVTLVLAVLFISCSSDGPSVINPETTQVTYDLSIVVTVGNRSYIPINISGKPSDAPSQILLILKAFEDTNPEVEIVDWKIEKRQEAHATSSKIYGIWLDHKPRD